MRKLKEFLQEKWRSRSHQFRGVAIFTSSAGVVQLFPLITAPIVSRLYTPTAFGAYAIFYSIIVMGGAISSLAYINVVLVEKEDSSAINAVGICLTINFLFSLLIGIVLLVIPSSLIVALFGDNVSNYLIFVPITVFFSGAYMAGHTWALRKCYYEMLAKNKIILGFSTMFLQIAIGFLRFETFGLIIANMIGYFIAVVMLYSRIYKIDYILIKDVNMKHSLNLFRNHYKFPLYSMPANILNNFATQIPNFLINKFYGASTLGQYNLGQRMVSMPLSFISSSVRDVFRQASSKDYNDNGNCRKTFNKTIILMSCLGLCILIPITFVVPYLFEIIFGHNWDQSGVFVKSIAFLLVVRFISSPLSYVWIVKGKQLLDMFWQLGLLLISVASFLFSFYVLEFRELGSALIVYSLAAGSWYLICIYKSYRLSGD